MFNLKLHIRGGPHFRVRTHKSSGLFPHESEQKLVTFGKNTYKNWKTYWLFKDSRSSSRTASTYSRNPWESTSKAMLVFSVLLSIFLKQLN